MARQEGSQLSAFERKALTVVREFPDGIYTRTFARRMWPESPAWTRVYGCGYGSTKGLGIMSCAGSNLARLVHKGLLARWRSPFGNTFRSYHPIRFVLSKRGAELLKGGEPKCGKII